MCLFEVKFWLRGEVIFDFSYVKEVKEITEKIETRKLYKKDCMPRTLACSFKRSCSIVKSRDEPATEKEHAEENKVQNTAENAEEQRQQEETVNTDSLQGSLTSSEIQGDQLSQCGSFTEEEKTVPEEKVVLQKAGVMPASCVEFKYKPAPVPEKNRFQAGITFVDSQGYVYAQEVKEGEIPLV